MKILFKLTTRSRHAKALETIKSIRENCISDNYIIVCSVDKDDTDSQVLFINTENILFINGTSKNKIDAINRDVNLIDGWDILVNVSDDQVFTKKGFDDAIRDAFKEFEEETGSEIMPDLDKFIHFPDGNQKNLATMSIIGRAYYERDKYIYHPDYKSLFCDNEAQEVAIKRGCYEFVDEDIFVHNHPAWGKAQTDAQYQHTESFWGEDEATYNRRKALNFNI